jgi:hypothetical protein
MHPEVVRFIAMFEQEAVRKGLYRKQLGKSEQLFLELVLGPALQYYGFECRISLKGF